MSRRLIFALAILGRQRSSRAEIPPKFLRHRNLGAKVLLIIFNVEAEFRRSYGRVPLFRVGGLS